MADLNNWYGNNTFHYKEFSIPGLIRLKNKKKDRISLCFPTLNESQTIGRILQSVNKYIYGPGPVDEVVVIDSGSKDNTVEIVESFGFKVYQQSDILKKHGTFKGKGDALWKSLSVLKGDIIVWCDSDIRILSLCSYTASWVPCLMMGPYLLSKLFTGGPSR